MATEQGFHAGYLVRWQLGNNDQSLTNTPITILTHTEVRAHIIYELIKEALVKEAGITVSMITIIGIFKLY